VWQRYSPLCLVHGFLYIDRRANAERVLLRRVSAQQSAALPVPVLALSVIPNDWHRPQNCRVPWARWVVTAWKESTLAAKENPAAEVRIQKRGERVVVSSVDWEFSGLASGLCASTSQARRSEGES